MKKKRRKDSEEMKFLPDPVGSLKAFNHLMGTDDISCDGSSCSLTGMSESMNDEVKNIFELVKNNFVISDSPASGPQFILPDGKFLQPGNAHTNVDDFIMDNFSDMGKLWMEYPEGYLLEKCGCIKCNDGKSNNGFVDCYMALPEGITTDQIYSIQDWLETFNEDELSVYDVKNKTWVSFDLSKGVSRLMNRLKEYKNSRVLKEDVSELPDLAEESIIRQEDAGIASMFIDAINECWTMLDNYHSIIVTLDSLGRHEFDETLQSLLEDRNKEIGSLQGILETISPAGDKIEQGKDESQEQLSFDEIDEEELKESNEPVKIIYEEHNSEPSLREICDWLWDNHNDYYCKLTKNLGALEVDEDLEDYVSYKKLLRIIKKDPRLAKSFADEFGSDWLIESVGRSYRKTRSLKEEWHSNGSLEDFDPKTLVDKAEQNKYPTNSVREFKDKLLYINVDLGYQFGKKQPDGMINLLIIELDSDNPNNQTKIYENTAMDNDEAIQLLNDWKTSYMSSTESTEKVEEPIDINKDIENGEENEEF